MTDNAPTQCIWKVFLQCHSMLWRKNEKKLVINPSNKQKHDKPFKQTKKHEHGNKPFEKKKKIVTNPSKTQIVINPSDKKTEKNKNIVINRLDKKGLVINPLEKKTLWTTKKKHMLTYKVLKSDQVSW